MAELRWLLRDSTIQTAHHGDDHRVQDPYSVRCHPQVAGAALDLLRFAGGTLEIEANEISAVAIYLPAEETAREALARKGWLPADSDSQ